MGLLNLASHRGSRTSTRRRSAIYRPALHPYLENLEQRTVLSGAGTALIGALDAAPVDQLLTITDINVSNVAITGANTLTATMNLSGQILGQDVTLPGLQVPVTLTGVGTTADNCPILHLSLQLPDLNLLGLHVRLDNCAGGPVTVDVTAQKGDGMLLGNLLCGVSGLLNGDLTKLTGADLQAVTGALTGALNGVLGSLATTTAAPASTIPPGDTTVLDLHLNPIHLDLLGLKVDTSAICLTLFADPKGGLLGSLLGNLNTLTV
ncbi:MAG: hypothetical protein NVSMB9_34420 [Isosphaeraceae bacterium]